MKLFGGGKPDHPMADLKAARKILDELPPQDLKALEELTHWHETLSAAEGFKLEDRAQRHSAIDDTASLRLRKLAAEYDRGSRAQQNLLWARIHEYWRQSGQAHSRTLDAKTPPGMLSAALRALAQQLKWQQVRYGPVDAEVWGLLNRVFATAEARGVNEAKPEFLKAALFSASSPDSLLAREIDVAERLISALAPAFAMAKAPALDLPYWTDLAQPMAPARGKQPPQPGPGVRYLGAGSAAATLAGWIKTVERSRQAPSDLKLGVEVDPEILLGVLRHLAAHWSSEPPERRHARRPMKTVLTIAHGFDGVLEALGGGDSLNFDKQAGEAWAVENISAGGFGAIAPQSKTDWVRVGTLVAAQPEGGDHWLVGTVRRVNRLSATEIRVGVQTLSHAPAVSLFNTKSAEAPGVLLPPPGPATGEAAIALRAGVFVPGENLERRAGERQHVYMPQGVAERGDDYEIVKFREMIRE
jgi:hypothetical protein